MTRKPAEAATSKAAPAKAKPAKAAAPAAAETSDKTPAKPKPVIPARPVPAHQQFLSKGTKPQSMAKDGFSGTRAANAVRTAW
jgi:hypothetical protein